MGFPNSFNFFFYSGVGCGEIETQPSSFSGLVSAGVESIRTAQFVILSKIITNFSAIVFAKVIFNVQYAFKEIFDNSAL